MGNRYNLLMEKAIYRKLDKSFKSIREIANLVDRNYSTVKSYLMELQIKGKVEMKMIDRVKKYKRSG